MVAANYVHYVTHEGREFPVSTVKWRVVWGSVLRSGFTQEIVDAHDADEALAIAGDRRPELFRPTMAFLVTEFPLPNGSS